jgi:Flp pilus assembly protein TadD
MMKNPKHLLLFVFLALSIAVPVRAADFDLRMDRLAGSLGGLKGADRTVVDEALQLIKKGENSLALVRLAALNKENPRNSSLRIMTAFVMLQLGNLVGAFEEAKRAERAPDGEAYKCWFLAKVALLAGDKKVCERELKHAQSAGYAAAEVKELKQQLERRQIDRR